MTVFAQISNPVESNFTKQAIVRKEGHRRLHWKADTASHHRCLEAHRTYIRGRYWRALACEAAYIGGTMAIEGPVVLMWSPINKERTPPYPHWYVCLLKAPHLLPARVARWHSSRPTAVPPVWTQSPSAAPSNCSSWRGATSSLAASARGIFASELAQAVNPINHSAVLGR